MRFRRWVVFTFAVHVLVVLLDKGAGLILFKLLEDRPDQKGAVDMLTVLPFIMMAVANLGLATSTVYFLRRKRFQVTEAAETTSLVAVVWGGVVVVAAIVLSQTVLPLLQPDWEFSLWYVVPISLCVPFLLTTSYFNSIQLAVDRVRDFNLVHLISSLSFLPLFFICYWVSGENPSHGIAFGRLTSTALVALATLFMLRGVVRWRPRLHWDFFKAGVTYGWKANMTSVLTYLNHRVDLFLVGFLFVPALLVQDSEAAKTAVLAQVAFYSIAVSFAELVWHFPEATRDLFFSKVAGSTHEQARVFTPSLCRLCLLAAILGSLGVYFLIDPLMQFLSPDQWGVTWRATVLPCLMVLMPGTVGYTVAKILQNDLAARGHLNHCLIACLLVLATMVALDFALIPGMGAIGAAWASSVAYLVASVYSLIAYSVCGGARIVECLVPRASDLQYLRDLGQAIREKLQRKPA